MKLPDLPKGSTTVFTVYLGAGVLGAKNTGLPLWIGLLGALGMSFLVLAIWALGSIVKSKGTADRKYKPPFSEFAQVSVATTWRRIEPERLLHHPNPSRHGTGK